MVQWTLCLQNGSTKAENSPERQPLLAFNDAPSAEDKDWLTIFSATQEDDAWNSDSQRGGNNLKSLKRRIRKAEKSLPQPTKNTLFRSIRKAKRRLPHQPKVAFRKGERKSSHQLLLSFIGR